MLTRPVLVGALVAAALLGWAEGACNDGVLDGQETDVDCGGNVCQPCDEREICVVDEDCAGEDGGCAGAQCFDMEVALRDATIFFFYFCGTFLLMCGCVLCECRGRLKSRIDAYKRRTKKAMQERERAAKAKVDQALEREEREKNRHNAVMQAYAAKMEAAAEEEESSDEEDDVPVSKPRRGILKMVSTMMGSTRMMREASKDNVDPEEAGAGPKKAKKKKKKVVVHVVTQNPEEEAVRLRQVFLTRLAELHRKVKEHVGKVRKDAAIVSLNSQVLKAERTSAVSKLRVLSLVLVKQGTLVNMTEAEVEHAVAETERAEEMIAEVLHSTNNDVEGMTAALQEAVDIMEDVADTVGSPVEADYFSTASEVMHWELGDPDLVKLGHQVETELASKKKQKEKLREKVMLANTSFVSAVNVTKQARRGSCLKRVLRSLWVTFLPQVFIIYPLFYLAFFLGMLAVAMPFAVKIGNAESNADLQSGGLLGSTFLPVPGYYNLDDHEEQRYWIPFVYTLMHCALYCFCWIPVPFWRGIWRDVSISFPSSRKYFPIDDMVFFHKLLGVLILGFIFCGGAMWLYALKDRCQDFRDARTCQAFDPLPPPDVEDPNETFAYNPFLNVLMLRKIVFTLWYPIFPLLHWTGGPPPRYAPRFVKQYFYEIAYYGHLTVAYTSLTIALISRFDVFYPALLTWGIYFLDLFREVFLRTYNSTIVIRPTFSSQVDEDENRTTVIHTDPKGVPTSMKILIEVPAGFKINAGQFVYVKIPGISGIQYHPFSLASASRDDYVQLHVGVIGQKKQWSQVKGGDWVQTTRPTFTYRLQQAVRNRITKLAFLDDPERQADEVAPLKVRLRGPYGSTFTKCFDPHYTGTVIIGAGTGLTAALSVLKELLTRKRRGDRVPKYCWFVWSCARVEDLLWVWEELHELIMGAIKDDILKPGKKWSKSANMLGWLGLTIYITRADKTKLAEFLARPITDGGSTLKRSKKAPATEEEAEAVALAEAPDAPAGPQRARQLANLRELWTSTNTNLRRKALNREVHNWMSHDRRLLSASMDDKHTHVSKLLAFSRLYIDKKAGKGKRMAVCFCGPGGLAHTIAHAASQIGSGMEFSADHQ